MSKTNQDFNPDVSTYLNRCSIHNGLVMLSGSNYVIDFLDSLRLKINIDELTIDEARNLLMVSLKWWESWQNTLFYISKFLGDDPELRDSELYVHPTREKILGELKEYKVPLEEF